MTTQDWFNLKIRDLNDARRDNLINKALELDGEMARAKFIVDYFTSQLPKNIIAEIDGVNEKDVVPFQYDYSWIKGSETPYARKQIKVKSPVGEGSTFSIGLLDIDVPGRPMIYPSIIGLKLGTCKSFSHEMARLMHSVGVECKIVETEHPEDCYDLFEGADVEGNHISVNTIKPIYHFYNVLTINGKEYKVDISGYLTAQDYNKNHPDGIKDPIDITQFIMNENLECKPFTEARANSVTD